MEPLSSGYHPLGMAEVGLAALLLLVNIGLSIGLRLGLERSLIVAAVRMTVQLLLVGLILQWVFALSSPLPVLGIALLMAALRRYLPRQPCLGHGRGDGGIRRRADRHRPGQPLV